MENNRENRNTEILVSIFFIVVSVLAIYFSKNWRMEIIRFPLVVAILLLIFSSADLLMVLLLKEKRGGAAVVFEATGDVEAPVALRRTVEMFGWMIGLGLFRLLLNFIIALPLFVFLYIKVVGRYSWPFSLLMGAVSWIFLYGLFVWLLNLPFPEGLLMQWLGLNI